MGTSIPKPFIKVNGKTILEYTVGKFAELPFVEQIVISVGKESIAKVQQIFPKNRTHGGKIQCVEGGKERQDSVIKALAYLDNPDLVAIHDAVRPLVTSGTIRKCCDVAYKRGAAVTGIPVKDTLKSVDTDERIRETMDRNNIWQAQTPQVFNLSLYRRAVAYSEKTHLRVTDDAGFIEALGEPVYMVKGESMNLKLTYPEDLPLIRTLLGYQDVE